MAQKLILILIEINIVAQKLIFLEAGCLKLNKEIHRASEYWEITSHLQRKTQIYLRYTVFSFCDTLFGLFYFLQLCLVGKLERKKLRFREREERTQS